MGKSWRPWAWYAVVGCVSFLLGHASNEVAHRVAPKRPVLIVYRDVCDPARGCP